MPTATEAWTFEQLHARRFSCGDGQLKTDMWSSSEDDVLAATKQQQQYIEHYSQESGTTATAEDRVIHTVYGDDGTIVAFEAGCVVACVGNATVSVDLHKNGASILSSAIELDSADAAYAVVAGTIDDADIEDGDVLEVIVTVSAGTGTLGKGVFASLVIREDASP